MSSSRETHSFRSSAAGALDPVRWRLLWGRVTGNAAGGAVVFDDLVRRHAGPGRHYHNAAHVAAMLALLDGVADAVPERDEVELAIWFHDAVYDSRAHDNEARSAELATRCLRDAGVPAAPVTRVSQLILATRDHVPPSGDAAAAWLLDFDLAVLAWPPAEFAAYEQAIRAEYAWVDDAAFARGRATVLERFLDRSRIYATEHFFAHCESTARDNLRRALVAWRG